MLVDNVNLLVLDATPLLESVCLLHELTCYATRVDNPVSNKRGGGKDQKKEKRKKSVSGKLRTVVMGGSACACVYLCVMRGWVWIHNIRASGSVGPTNVRKNKGMNKVKEETRKGGGGRMHE